MRKIISRLLVFVLTSLAFWSLATKPAQAGILDWLKAQFQSEEASNNMTTSITQEGVSGEKHVTETTSNLMNVINLHVLGPPINEEATASSMIYEGVGPGLIGVVNSGIVAMYDPPASSRIYVADLLQNAKIIPQAQAQGLGFTSLDPILETWKQFRNIAYLFFVVIFLVIGFMIMFRAKIGQAAITVQQAIPSIIVALLTVTFSYAIAGFLIDLMYVIMYMLATFFERGQELITGNFFDLVGAMFTDFWDSMHSAIDSLMNGLLGRDFFMKGVLEWLSTLSGVVIVGLAILIGTFKIFFELLKSYISIILQVVFSPITLMVGAIPGKNVFFSWIKNLIGNLMMWPLVMICLLINRMLTQGTYGSVGSGGFMPPFLIGTGQGDTIPILVGIGILLVIPEIMKEAKKKLGVEDGIMGNLAGAAWKRVQPVAKSAEAAMPYAGGAAASLAGGARSMIHLAGSEQSPLRQAGGLKGLINQDPEDRKDSLDKIRNTLTQGYENKKGKIVGGTKTTAQRAIKRGKRNRIILDRALGGRLFDAENVESLLAKRMEREEEKEKEEQRIKEQSQSSKANKEEVDEIINDA